MPMYRVRGYRRQMVEAFVYAEDDEWAADAACDIKDSEWDVIDVSTIDEFFSILEMPDEPDDWEEE